MTQPQDSGAEILSESGCPSATRHDGGVKWQSKRRTRSASGTTAARRTRHASTPGRSPTPPGLVPILDREELLVSDPIFGVKPNDDDAAVLGPILDPGLARVQQVGPGGDRRPPAIQPIREVLAGPAG